MYILTQILGLYKQIFCLLQTYWKKSDSANSETLFNVLCENFETMKLNLKKISGLCTDGAREVTNEKDIEDFWIVYRWHQRSNK